LQREVRRRNFGKCFFKGKRFLGELFPTTTEKEQRVRERVRAKTVREAVPLRKKEIRC